ncbi:hypothetical protein KBD08_02735 [Candidatus Babeliales bacterium]|nr:hypothetical protein [Candidatus Babeliales bacterium]
MAVLLEEEGILGKIPVAHLDTQCELITKDIIECAQFDDRRDVELFMYEHMYKNLQKK